VHQFVKIGAYAFVGGSSKVTQDVPPYLKAAGNPVKIYGLNSVGLQRANMDPAVVRELKRAYRIFFRSELIMSRAMERAREELESFPEVEHFLSFVSRSERGLAV
jgi:UDP-N-acetylglucosamine acyltransferase